MADTRLMQRVLVCCSLIATFMLAPLASVQAQGEPSALLRMRADLRAIARNFHGASAIAIKDLATGYEAGYNAGASMPAASTIKVPVMVEVFHKLQGGAFDLNTHVTLEARDKDYGSGELCDAPVGSSYPVSELLEKMIDISDNTATNMLIRLVGRTNINDEMADLGLDRTRLTADVRTEGWAIRTQLRSSPSDMVRLLTMMAKRQLVDEWSSNEMISILEADQFNTLIPAGLPDDVTVAHKTGSLFDTLNDVGIVYAESAPYVIAVMTTGIPSKPIGRTFIHSISHIAFRDEQALGQWRASMGLQAFVDQGPVAPSTPDLRYWNNSAVNNANTDGD